ncbi:ABC transporter substrate-binding protein [Streptococcus pseudoporcinus]|uniref:ABC transporter, solute-binding protein n=1 Tax=Streptococcus pseudoporcinus LQ 940-04 TaxID=875093 RepID=G5K885_9STRE|nr:extracellular solute-binding protein [Streptococcus pseudoporcinus]EFR44961.1 ABC transporter, solute-binding protein [Streptococcus pseudoporcinus SPIN 20026]EHI65283.1 ABC transporter, solute-binding protein [Streptococcus pseudoporcinus LQ 940-04]VEF94030.1 extracellular solute-binding lipoprotein [Streptococcus pseudoporcinus]
MKKSILRLVTLALIPLLGLAACSTKEADKKKKDQNEIEVWLTPQWKGTYKGDEKGADYDSFFKTAAKMYEKDHPGKKISVQVIPGEERDSKLSVATQTKTLPDIFFESTFAISDLAHQGLLAPLDSTIDQKNKADISKSVWDNVTINHKTYFYPFAQNPGMLAYNADMFEKAGLQKYLADKDKIANWSLEDFQMILKKLKESDSHITPLGFYAKNNQGDTWTMMYLRMYGSSFFDKSGKLNVNDKKGVHALDYIKELKDKKMITSGAESLTSNDVNAMFQNKKVAISFTNAVLYKGMLDSMAAGTVNKFDARLANIPSVDGPKSFTYVLGSAVFNTNGDKRQKLAKDFVKYYSENKELIKASMNFMPVRKSLVEQEKANHPMLETYINNDQYVINFSNNTSGYVEVRNALFPEIQAVLTGEKTSKEALDTFVEKGNKAISQGIKRSKILNNK